LERITILGGEPMLHPEIERIAELVARKTPGEKRITTNLTKGTPEQFSLLAKLGFRICISIDGASSDLHDKIRGNGSFQKTIDMLDAIRDSCHDIEVTHTLNSNNIDHFPSMLELCRSLNLTQLNLHKISPRGNALVNRTLDVSPTKWRELVSWIQKQHVPEGKPAIRVRYELTFVTELEYMQLVESGAYDHHAKKSYYSKVGGNRIVIFPDQRLYISSEAFGTNSYFADISNGEFHLNTAATNEFFAADNPNFEIEKINNNLSGDENFPKILSVSYRLASQI
jgi:sulfatase maturation enzyme AslB (radical SAM superfamily)